ncbi:hypothetical protein KP77_27770 [Jeotgalibacillus alimentarius]|uniref:Mannosyl-glycoprotein endo-beta-N-acetylglucosamidase-like domain-containing protein n=1 Tax=Jeotgalibacillus alimentarius TaxID=135826 RepID=A0A0C2R8R0_9BACL|nr:glucosaminidase domain-containing protein [Jeotgalibacillus alimentarius]KIL46650.1 hypothetical protein KP77_27770 [Jeotgalibacillus alimentarius]
MIGRKRYLLSLLFCLIAAVGLSSVAHASDFSEEEVQSGKVWTVKFNETPDPDFVNEDTIQVTDEDDRSVNVTYETEGNSVKVYPPAAGYEEGARYVLTVSGVRNSDGDILSKAAVKPFVIEETSYWSAVIDENGEISKNTRFDSFEAAAGNLSADEIIVHKNEIIKMSDGVVSTKAEGVTIVYVNESLLTHTTYVEPYTELVYIDSTPDWIKVKAGSAEGYIKAADAVLIPESTLNERSHYVNADGELVHNIYNHASESYSSYSVGPAPSFINEGTRYLSSDGTTFTDWEGNEAGTHYQYFQFLSARSSTDYTAEEIDEYIVDRLIELEETYPNSSVYQNASAKSKLIGIGESLKKIEQEHNVNALTILALAQHESRYGLSARAQDYNNLFGLYVYDSNPAAKYFDSIEENIEELIKEFFNKNYLPPNRAYANGAVFGHKAIGMNVRYASDPYWGAKAAGHMYRIDQAMGGQEFEKYQLGITTTAGLNVRTGPGTQFEKAFTYDKSNMPILILDDSSYDEWLVVKSDDPEYDELYVFREYVMPLN